VKTRELIERLKQLDPEGGLDVCIKPMEHGNVDVGGPSRLPGYYDGPAQRLVRDAEGRVVEAVISKVQDKICLEPQSIQDALEDNPDLPVRFDHEPTPRELEELEAWRKRGRER